MNLIATHYIIHDIIEHSKIYFKDGYGFNDPDICYALDDKIKSLYREFKARKEELQCYPSSNMGFRHGRGIGTGANHVEEKEKTLKAVRKCWSYFDLLQCKIEKW